MRAREAIRLWDGVQKRVEAERIKRISLLLAKRNTRVQSGRAEGACVSNVFCYKYDYGTAYDARSTPKRCKIGACQSV